MPRPGRPRAPSSSSSDDDDDVEMAPAAVVSQFKLIAELIAETDRNLPNEVIERDLAKLQRYFDVADWKGISRYFDTLSSISRRASTYENWENRVNVYEYLVNCFENLKEAITDYMTTCFETKRAGGDVQVDRELVHTVLMYVILSTRFTIQLQLYSTGMVQKKKKLQVPTDNEPLKKRFMELRNPMINCLIALLEFKLRVEEENDTRTKNIDFLFAPDTMEQDFLQRFMDLVTGLLEDPDNAARGSQGWIKHFFRIWKTLAADYGMQSAIANSLFTHTFELSYLETATTFPFIEPLVQLMKERDNGSGSRIHQPLRIVLDLVVRRVCKLYTNDRRDNPPPKAYCMMITSLAINVHDLMLQHLIPVTELLHNPHPNVRMATLQGLADMFSSPFLSAKMCADYTSRDLKRLTIFQRIVAHTNDEATHVRSKSISLLRSLMENGFLPEHFLSIGLVTIVGKRLNDKSVQVRKSAIQFLTVFLERNKFGHDFNVDDHLIKLDMKLRELKLSETKESRALQHAETDYQMGELIVFANLRNDIIQYLKGKWEGNKDTYSISRLMKDLFLVGTATELLKYYTTQPGFPYQRSERDSHSVPDEAVIELIANWFKRASKEDYLNSRVQEILMNDPQVIEEEQFRKDNQFKCAQLRGQIQQLIDKMCIESELSRCVDMALRCVLMGEAAEIKEGIKFLTKCKQFEITGAENAIRSMCSLVWRPGSDVLDELIEAAEDIFISKMDDDTEKASERDRSTVDNLMNAMHGVEEKDRPSVEQVIFLLVSKDPKADPKKKTREGITPNVLTRLWAMALDSSTGASQRKIDALRILFPISRTEKGIADARARLRSLQKKLTEEPAVAVEALRIISILSTPTKFEKEAGAHQRPIFRVHPEDSLFSTIETLFFHEVLKADDDPKRDWFGIVRYTIATILNIGMDVNVLLPKLAAQFLFRAKSISEFYMFYNEEAKKTDDSLRKSNAYLRRDYWALTWCRVMEKLMAFIGEVAVQLHAFIQVTIPKLYNRYVAKMLDAEKPESKTREEPARLISELERSIAQRKTIFAVPSDLTPGNTSNELHHLVSTMCDKRLFLPSKLLGRLLPIVVYAMRAKTMPPRVKQAALIAYGKFMPISADISSFAAPSFFSAMSNSPTPLIRCNLIAACCDFAFAQPTIFELYAPALFRMSQDESSAARESAILVLSHLMGNDMIQPRGVLSEPARCICDNVRAVRDVAQSFFREFNSRSDTIVHMLPEFLYRLSSTGERMPFKGYKTVFEFLIQLIKEKAKANTDMMIDRVCSKFVNIDINDVEAPKYLLVALAKFAQNEGGIHKLQENWSRWSRFLCHAQVAREYRQMIEHLESSSKSEDIKTQCRELIQRIEKIQEEGLTEKDMDTVPATSKRGRGRRPAAAQDTGPGPSTKPLKRTRKERKDRHSPTASVSDSDEAMELGDSD